MSETLWWWVEFGTGLLVFAILLGMWMHLHHDQERLVWRCVRYQGGGVLQTPKRMTLAEATEWLGRTANVEVAHVDANYGFIFYRPRGG